MAEKLAKIAVLPCALAVLILLVIPIPTPILDILIAVNLLFALTIIITALCIKKPSDFSSLPTLLLLSTIFSVALNVAATRLILTKGEDFDGRLIRFVASIFTGSGETVHVIIGFAIFIVLLAISVVLISKGVVRIAEAACRFTLDSMQVKFMAVETEYSSGAIGQEEVALLKEKIQKESDFFASLDGAVKFISGNVKVNLLIIGVIVFGGILIGVLHDGKSVNDAAATYIPLAIGSGFLAMLPSLLLSVVVGLVVTRGVRDL